MPRVLSTSASETTSKNHAAVLRVTQTLVPFAIPSEDESGGDRNLSRLPTLAILASSTTFSTKHHLPIRFSS